LRGGARLLDFGGGNTPVHERGGLASRDTLPYGAVTLSLAPTSVAPSYWSEPPLLRISSVPPTRGRILYEEERTSNVYLRCARLSSEWYDLTGSDQNQR
jgi:hypothetical protein